MKLLHRFFGFLYSFALILILLVTAFDVACYSDYGFFKKEYEKYQVPDSLSMEMDDIMTVTRHMMEYLRGEEESMQISTVVGGQSRDFFNDQDLFHMAEVKNLFLGMFHLRTGAVLVLLVSLAVLFAAKAERKTLFLCFQASLGLFLGLAAVLGILIAFHFSQAFVIFHHIFFDNDLWLFDPSTDLMINMLPEGLFLDFSVRILTFFVLFLGAFEIVLLAASRLLRKRKAPQHLAAGIALSLFLTSLTPLTALAAAPQSPPAAGQQSALAAMQADPAASQTGALASPHSILPAGDDLTGLPGWPAGPEVQADAAILIDARTGNILYAKNIDTPYPPASITKILTALIACEQSNFNDTIVYSHNAIYSIPYDGSTVGFSEDEAVSMKDSLYGLMLKSGNEAALGIAEHISGSVEAFANTMNERAQAAGATNSNFVNPNGLHDNNHYTTCYDMAMIMKDAVRNDSFLEIASTVNYSIAPTNIAADGYTFTTGHRMLNKNRTEFYEFAVAGKTGYTSNAGNTLVTYAKNGDMELICVILHSIQTHYNDTRTLCDYGFSNFTCHNAAAQDTAYNSEGSGFFSFLSGAFEKSALSVKLDDCFIVLPSSVPFSSLTSRLNYSETAEPGSNILGYVHYEYQGIEVGKAALRLTSVQTSSGASAFSVFSQNGSGTSGNGFSSAPSKDTSAALDETPAPDISPDSLPGLETPEENSLQSGASQENSPETKTPAQEPSRKIITINIWHLIGYLILGLLAVLAAALLLYRYSPKQRRMRKAREMRRIYMTGEKKKKKKRRELR